LRSRHRSRRRGSSARRSGASRSAWLYDASISKGFTLDWGDDLLASATLQRQIASTGNPLDRVGGELRYFAPQTRRYALYAMVSGDRLGDGAAAPDQLMIGGDNGLRGYPLRYQSGDRRALFTIEERAYTDWYPFRLVRVGGAVFYDRGRAWGGVNQNIVNPGWLSDVGVGLRLALDRAAFGNVLHADVAVPLERAPGIKSVQFIVKTQVSF
jgi:hemolysin activation/secretion protein